MDAESTKALGLTDAPILTIRQENLGLEHYVEALSDFVIYCQTPMTIAIQGDWGSGKTSMMYLVRDQLSNSLECRIKSCWFNTWMFAQFQNQDDIPLSLLAAFLDEIGAGGSSQTLAKVGRAAKGVLGGALKTAVDMGTGGGGDIVKDAVDRWTATDTAAKLKQLRKQISDEIRSILERENADRLVIFIDDLDRLIPERAVEILEIMKIFLDVEHCVFILAVDYQVVSKGLQQKFGVSAADLKGKSFFDKIIQMPFNLPVAQYDIHKYIRGLFKERFSFSEDDTGLLIELARYSIGSNPRSLKRLFNTLQLLKIVADKKGMLGKDDLASTEERERLLFAVLCLQLSYEHVYHMLLRDRNILDSGYLKMLCDKGELEADENKLAVVKKHFTEVVNEGEALEKFIKFMRQFVRACDLENSDDQPGVEGYIAQDECELLVKFLSLSSLTHAGSDGEINLEGDFRHSKFIYRLWKETLLPRYQAQLKRMDTEFEEPALYEDRADIDFYFKKGKYSFWLGLYWSDPTDRKSGDPDNDQCCIGIFIYGTKGSGDKWATYSWFNENFEDCLNLSFPDLRRRQYGEIDVEEFPYGLGRKKELKYLEKLKDIAIRGFDIIIPRLVELYEA